MPAVAQPQRLTRHGEPLRKWLDRQLEQHRADRQSYDAHYEDLASQFAPGCYKLASETPLRDGSKRHQDIYDGTSLIVVQRAVAGLMGHVTPKARQWFRYGVDNSKPQHTTRSWLDDTTQQATRALLRSNVYDVLPMVYEAGFVFGTGAMFVEQDPETVIHCHFLETGGYWLGLDSKLQVSQCFREFTATLYQLVDQFGEDKLCRSSRNAWNKGERQTLVKVVHAIYPRNAAEKPVARRGPMDAMAMPFASVYYETGASMDEGFLREGGYRRMPVLAFPWRRKGSSPYGDSPCMAALPFDRQLQAMTLTKGEVAALAAKPPVQAPIALKNQRLDLDAGGVTYYDQTTQYAGVRPLIERAPDINPLREDVLDIRDQIRSALYVDLFLALNRIDQRMTAREVDARVREGLTMLGPVVHNLDTSLLNPLLDIVYEHLLEGGALLPFPTEMAGASFQPEYLGILHQAQRASELQGLNEYLSMAQALVTVTQRPDAADKINSDNIMDIAANALGISPRASRSTEDLEQMRQARAEMQAAQAQAEATQMQAKAARDAAAAPTDGANALTDGLVQGIA